MSWSTYLPRLNRVVITYGVSKESYEEKGGVIKGEKKTDSEGLEWERDKFSLGDLS